MMKKLSFRSDTGSTDQYLPLRSSSPTSQLLGKSPVRGRELE